LPLGITVDIAARYQALETHKSETCAAFDARVRRTEAILGHLLSALQRGDIPLGAARTRGLGRVACSLTSVRYQQLDSRVGMLATLAGEDTVVAVHDLCAKAPATRPQPQPRLTLTIRWRPCGPLMVQAGYNGMGVDILPLVSATTQGVALVLPGSSLKGALRSQAERIVRTVLEQRASASPQGRERFLQQIEDLPLISALFGARAQTREAWPGAAAPVPQGPLPGLGALAVEDCYACDTMPYETWSAVATAAAPAEQSYEQQELHKVLKTLKRLTVAHHVAIDRWTSGAADGMLFSVLAPDHMAWHDMQLHLDLGRLPEASRLPGLTLVLLTVRDLFQHRLSLGFATNRGMGEVEVLECTFAGVDLETLGLEGLADVRVTEPGFHALDAALRARLTQEWQAWISKYGKQAR
jgi:CRISPR/Cas system CSM-associated protein Csm3 (group 7 of RAMP superfamily)